MSLIKESGRAGKRVLSLSFPRTPSPLLAGVLSLLLFAGQAPAHSVHIFAWTDGDRICSESYFSKKSRVRDGEALMTDASGKILARSRTDAEGLACFPLPDKAQDLTFSILAGPGHRGEFSLRAVDLAASFPQTSLATDSSPSAAVAETVFPRTLPPSDQADRAADLRAVVQQELRRQLAPILQALAEIQADKAPGLNEIIGGIGWILGLAALTQWLAARRKRPAEGNKQEKS
jgi:nickel transport protein